MQLSIFSKTLNNWQHVLLESETWERYLNFKMCRKYFKVPWGVHGDGTK